MTEMRETFKVFSRGKSDLAKKIIENIQKNDIIILNKPENQVKTKQFNENVEHYPTQLSQTISDVFTFFYGLNRNCQEKH